MLSHIDGRRMQVRGLPISALRKQRIVVVGAGSAGMGVVSMIAQGALEASSAPALLPYAVWPSPLPQLQSTAAAAGLLISKQQ